MTYKGHVIIINTSLSCVPINVLYKMYAFVAAQGNLLQFDGQLPLQGNDL